tara:strand:+ start:6049 stop:6237 length:189 start_codon:yes stop_codon:yes gene_type:complete
MGKQRNRGIGISIYFPKDMLTLIDDIEKYVHQPNTLSGSLSEYVCTAIREKAEKDRILSLSE